MSLVLFLIVVGAVGLLAALVALAARQLGLEPRWLPALRHTWGEAGHRAGMTWSEFRDWVRIGR